MTVGTEQIVSQHFIAQSLLADPVLADPDVCPGGVVDGAAPEHTPDPYIHLTLMSATDIRVAGPYIIGVNELWIVAGITAGASFEPLKPIASRIHAVLHNAGGYADADGTVWMCVREGPFQQASTAAGREYRRLGGIYRMFTTTN